MAGAYDRLIAGRPTKADKEWLSWLYGEHLNRVAPITIDSVAAQPEERKEDGRRKTGTETVAPPPQEGGEYPKNTEATNTKEIAFNVFAISPDPTKQPTVADAGGYYWVWLNGEVRIAERRRYAGKWEWDLTRGELAEEGAVKILGKIRPKTDADPDAEREAEFAAQDELEIKENERHAASVSFANCQAALTAERERAERYRRALEAIIENARWSPATGTTIKDKFLEDARAALTAKETK
jgi:hypothetical protein